MLKWLCLLFFTLSFALEAFSVNLPAKVSITVAPVQENENIVVDISIIRLEWQKVDINSFQIGSSPQKALFIDEHEAIAGMTKEQSTIVSQYQITLPPKPQGLYVLPSVSVVVGGARVAAPQVSYQVIVPEKSSQLGLEARAVETGPFYPGEKLTFEYRIVFQSPIELTKEQLPLLELDGFQSIGAPTVQNVLESPNTVQVIRQQVRAIQPGEYHAGVSQIEGYIYSVGSLGENIRQSPLLIAQAPGFVVTVLPFPEQGKSSSFNGAIGVFHWRVKRLGSGPVVAGEKLSLEVLVSGQGDLDTVTMPDLRTQKGFPSSFYFQDLAPTGQIEEGTKRFVITLRPISLFVKEVPSIEFSSFDPVSKTYVVKKSDSIPITVEGATRPAQENREQEAPPVQPIEIQGNIMLKESERTTWHMETILLLYAALFLGGVIVVQFVIRNLIKDSKTKTWQSHDLFMEAIKKKQDPDACCKLLKQALLFRLFETKQTSQLVSVPQELSQDGLQGEIRRFLLSIEEKQFTGLKVQTEIQGLIEEASQLYYRLKNV